MKNFFSCLLFVSFLQACQNEKAAESTEATPVTPGTDNVNGNLPDTNGSLKLNQPLPKDSSHMNDSITH
jgi:hypothetical protein